MTLNQSQNDTIAVEALLKQEASGSGTKNSAHFQPAKDKPSKKSAHPMNKKAALIGVGLLLSVLLGRFGYLHYMYVSTDNATIQAPTTLLSSKVSGIILHSDVQENQKVKMGQLLAEIRPDDYSNILDQTQADLGSLEAQVNGARSNYLRTVDLLKKGASTKERLDTAESQYRSLDRKLKALQAQVNQAKLNLDYTQIKAPADGKVGKKSFEVGMLASTGQPLMGFVAGNERWVVANFKETDLDYIVEGEKAEVSVDAISGKEFEGVVESISPATGATFSLLPPDNATGNFTKVVQRVPVRIKLLNLSERDMDRLQAGLSADVKVKVH